MEDQFTTENKTEEQTVDNIPPPPELPITAAEMPRRPKAVTAIAVLVIVSSIIFLLISALTEYFVYITSTEPSTDDIYLASWFALQGVINVIKLPLAFFLLAMQGWARKALVIVCLVELCSLVLVHFVPMIIPAMWGSNYSITAETIYEVGITLLFIVFNDAIPLLALTRRKIKGAFGKV